LGGIVLGIVFCLILVVLLEIITTPSLNSGIVVELMEGSSSVVLVVLLEIITTPSLKWEMVGVFSDIISNGFGGGPMLVLLLKLIFVSLVN